MEVSFRARDDGVVDIEVTGSRAWSEALNDSLGTRPPRGDTSSPPSTFWIDRVLMWIDRNDGTPVELSSGNATAIDLDGTRVVASSLYEMFESVEMSVDEFVDLLQQWRAEALERS